jgi:hypothetical protein
LYLLFKDKGFSKPFTQQQMSDGTLKMFCYLLLLQDPEPPPFICIEEPENGLYHKLLETLATEFREHATGRKGGAQVFITTHQPYFIDALKPSEVWVLEKNVAFGIAIIWMQAKFMHFEILVEGQTELTALSYLMSKIIGEYEDPHTWKIHKHQGIGHLPDNKMIKPNKNDRTLLHNLPSKLRAYGNGMKDNEVVILLVDLDDRKDCVAFKNELKSVLVLKEKKKWTKAISPYMDVNNNLSPSFCCFRDGIRTLANS